MRLAASRAVLHYYRAYLHPNGAFLPLTLEGAFARTSIRRVTTRTHAVLSPPILRGCTRRKIFASSGDGLFTYAHRPEPTYTFEPISQNQAMYHSVLNPSSLIRCLPFGSEKASPPEKPPLTTNKVPSPHICCSRDPRLQFQPFIGDVCHSFGAIPIISLCLYDVGDCGKSCPKSLCHLVYLRRRNVAISCT